MTSAPKIGEPRLYDGEIPILYPGERAQATDFALVETDEPGIVHLQPVRWMVEAAPGPRAWYLRWRYRLFGRRQEE